MANLKKLIIEPLRKTNPVTVLVPIPSLFWCWVSALA